MDNTIFSGQDTLEKDIFICSGQMILLKWTVDRVVDNDSDFDDFFHTTIQEKQKKHNKLYYLVELHVI